MLTGKHMNQQAEIHIFINYSDLDKIRTDLKFNSAKVAGYLRYYKCKANSEGISKMTSNERQKKIIRLLDKRRKDTMEHLSIEFHVSTDTISRDIATLNEDYVKNTISKAATNHPLLRTLAQTKQLAEHYTYLKPLTEFDEYEFKFAVNRVLVDSESCTFELKNGMKFKEIF